MCWQTGSRRSKVGVGGGWDVSLVMDNHRIWLADGDGQMDIDGGERTRPTLMCRGAQRNNTTFFLHDASVFSSGDLLICKYATEGKLIDLN